MTLFGALLVAFFVVGAFGVLTGDEDENVKMIAVFLSFFFVIGIFVWGTGHL